MTIHVRCKFMFEMFQVFQTYVANVLSGCCICCTSYIRMLQVYVLNVLAGSNVCCKCFIWMLHMLKCPYTYVVNISSVSDVYCSKCFMLQVFHKQAWRGSIDKGGPRGHDSRRGAQSCIHGRGSKRGARRCIHRRVVGMEHEAASMGR